MRDYEEDNIEEIHSKILRAGRRTYSFDVRETKASDYYLTITESKKFTNEDGSYYYKKHKIYLYKEDFKNFTIGINTNLRFKNIVLLCGDSRSKFIEKQISLNGKYDIVFIDGGHDYDTVKNDLTN